MSERDQAKDAGHEQKPQAQIEQQAQEEALAGGIFGLPATMQSAELSGEPQDGAYNAETSQSADLLAHGGWEGNESGGGLAGADDGEGGLAVLIEVEAEGPSAEADGGGRAQVDEAIARLRAAVAAGNGAIDRAAARAEAEIEGARRATEARIEAGHGDCIAALGRAVRHGRTLGGAKTMAGRIRDEARDAVAWSTERARGTVADAAEGGREGLLALEALHIDRIERRAGDARVAAEALAAIERAVRVALGRIRSAVEDASGDVSDAAERAGERFDRLVADVRYADARESVDEG